MRGASVVRALSSKRGSVRPCAGAASERAVARGRVRRLNSRATRALRLRNSWVIQPSETDVRSSSSSLACFSSRRRHPKPAATARQASVAMPVTTATASRSHPDSAPSASSVGSRSIQSPTTPPRPTGSGQLGLRGKAAAQPAASTRATSQNRRRKRSRCKGRWVASRQPQTATGSTSASAATPSSWISRSATMAPDTPSMLRTGALVAWLSEGSCTDQVANAIASSAASTSSARPPSSRRRRRSASRTVSGRKVRLSRPRPITDMRFLTPARPQGDAAPAPWSPGHAPSRP